MEQSANKKTDPEELIRAYMEGAPGEEFEFTKTLPTGERVTKRYRMQVLRPQESHDCLRDAQKYAKEMGEHQDYGDIYKEEQAIEVILRALRQTEKYERPDGTGYYPQVFTDARLLRWAFTETELAVLLNVYSITKAKYGTLEGLNEADAETWVARLSDPLRGAYFLSQLDVAHWPGCIRLLAGVSRDLYQAAGLTLPSLDDSSGSGLQSSTSGTSSSGEPPSASFTDLPDAEVSTEKILSDEEAREVVAGSKPKE